MRIGIDASRAFVENPTGTERYAYEIITRMISTGRNGHEYILYVKRGQSDKVPHPGNGNVQITEIPLPYLWTQTGLAARTWVDKPDVLWIPAHTLPVLRIPGMRTVVTIHGIEYEWLPAYENSLQRWYLPWSTVYAVRSATKVIAVSEFTRKQLIERLGTEKDKISVVHEGYDVQVSNSKSKVLNKTQVLKKYQLQPDRYILFVGTLQPRKNLERLIEAFAGLDDSGLRLVIAGKPGWNYDPIYRAVTRYRVEDRTIFTGYIDDSTRNDLLSCAMAYIQPSITEGFGLPVLEAMAAGIPVACSNGGALPEVAGGAAILFDPLDTSQIRQSLRTITGDGRLRKKIAEKGKRRVKEMDWNNAASKTLDLIVRVT